jgi:acyl dehydratase
VTERYFEDYVPGTEYDLGRVLVDADEVRAFAERYDPQPFHLDQAAADDGPFGGMSTSGWHTCAMVMRLLVDNYLSPVSSLGSPGVDELRWLLPVRPGDQLHVVATVLEARTSQSRPERGILRTNLTATNQDGGLALTMIATTFQRRRDA